MPDTREPRTVLEAAEQAAGGGDYVSAERLLRKAAELQEKALGPLHPDLANTLNNLGIVCEITDKPDDAEQFFRRASEIAKASLPADHPFVATSRKNLEDFCKAKGRAVDPIAEVRAEKLPPLLADVLGPDRMPVIEPEPKPVVAPKPAPVAAPKPVPVTAPKPAPVAVPEPVPVAAPEPFEAVSTARPQAGFLIACALIAGFVATALLMWLRSGDAPPPSTEVANAPVASAPSTASKPEPSKPAPSKSAPPAPASPRTEPVPPRRPAPVPAAEAPKATPRSPASPPLVASARLCRSLSTGGDWQCAPAADPVSPGPLVFLTRIKSPTDTTVFHRWYRGDRLLRSVELRIRANPSEGYRTFSRNTVNAQGDWRVELRTSDGGLLHEERFVVR